MRRSRDERERRCCPASTFRVRMPPLTHCLGPDSLRQCALRQVRNGVTVTRHTVRHTYYSPRTTSRIVRRNVHVTSHHRKVCKTWLGTLHYFLDEGGAGTDLDRADEERFPSSAALNLGAGSAEGSLTFHQATFLALYMRYSRKVPLRITTFQSTRQTPSSTSVVTDLYLGVVDGHPAHFEPHLGHVPQSVSARKEPGRARNDFIEAAKSSVVTQRSD
ncbi:hypothetical protein HPB50_016868 [Hyalomma asiaticum]|uniref:Uncharacterized protein n=1 Tax=Hyalomma asiaticum TaxID=266040 RepID=A0ACB7S0P5_HYAAI|nr:hypothetical protein HPB50_016868 [Hyalomma asiaticum]